MLEERLREIFEKMPQSREDMLWACRQAFSAIIDEARNADTCESLCRELEREREKSLRLELELRDVEKRNEKFAEEFGGYKQDCDGLEEFVLEIFRLLSEKETGAEVLKELRGGVISRKHLSDGLEKRLWLL